MALAAHFFDALLCSTHTLMSVPEAILDMGDNVEEMLRPILNIIFDIIGEASKNKQFVTYAREKLRSNYVCPELAYYWFYNGKLVQGGPKMSSDAGVTENETCGSVEATDGTTAQQKGGHRSSYSPSKLTPLAQLFLQKMKNKDLPVFPKFDGPICSSRDHDFKPATEVVPENLEARLDSPSSKSEGGLLGKNSLDAYFNKFVISELSFFQLALGMGIGFDQKKSKADVFQLWLDAQPKVNDRDISVDRMRAPDDEADGLVDILVGRQPPGKGDLCQNLTKQDCRISLYALDNVTGLQRGEAHESSDDVASAAEQVKECEQVPIRCMFQNIVGTTSEFNGIVHTDSHPRGCSYQDVKAAFHILTNTALESAQKETIESAASEHEKMMVYYRALTQVYSGFDLKQTFDGWIDLYHVLYYRCGLPTVNDTNTQVHKFLIPRSFAEMTIRIILMHHALIKVRMAILNGQGRGSSFRHVATCTIPSSMPLVRFTNQNGPQWALYFDKINKQRIGETQETAIRSKFLTEMMKPVRANVWLPALKTATSPWTEHATQLLQLQSRHDLYGIDKASSKTFAQVMWEVTKSMTNRPDEVNFLAWNPRENTNDPKNLHAHFKQMLYIPCRTMFKYRGWKAMQSLGKDTHTFVGNALMHSTVKRHWETKPEDDKAQGPAVKDLELKSV